MRVLGRCRGEEIRYFEGQLWGVRAAEMKGIERATGINWTVARAMEGLGQLVPTPELLLRGLIWSTPGGLLILIFARTLWLQSRGFCLGTFSCFGLMGWLALRRILRAILWMLGTAFPVAFEGGS